MINTEDYADDFIAAQKAAAIANGRTDPFIIKYTDYEGTEQEINTEDDYSLEIPIDEDGNTEEQFYDGTKTSLQRQFDSLSRHFTQQFTVVTTTPVSPPAESQVLLVETSGDRVINLPDASDSEGKTITVKRTDSTSNIITVVGTIDEDSDYVMFNPYGSQSFYSDGTEWWTLDPFHGSQRGSESFAASSSEAVSFSDPMPIATYSITVEPDADPGGGWWITSKTINGFTINFSGSVTLTANWEARI